MRGSCLTALAVTILTALPAHAEISVRDVWIRATAGSGDTTAGYAIIANSGPGADRLISIRTADADRTELHLSTQVDGKMSMEAVPRLEVPPGAAVEMKAGSYHLMISRLSHPLQAGDKVALTFTFERQGPVQVEATVLPINATQFRGTGDDVDHASHHHHPDSGGGPVQPH
jgi:copper(I)-binding protein